MPAGIDLSRSVKFYYVKLCTCGSLITANDYFNKQFSFSLNINDNRNSKAFIHPGDHAIHQQAIANCLTDPGKKANTTVRMLTEDGCYFLTEWEFSACLNSKGNIEGVEGLGIAYRDFTFDGLSLQMQLQSLRSLSDSSSDGILLLDKNYTILAYNKPAENLSLELYKRQYLTGDDFRAYVRQEVQGDFNRQFNKALNGIISEEIFELGKKDGVKVCLKVQMTPVHDNEGIVSGVAIITKDITLLQNLNNRLNEITAIQSHQIRRPVANMISLVNLMDNGLLTGEQKEYLQLLRVSIAQLEDEIQTIVKTARAI